MAVSWYDRIVRRLAGKPAPSEEPAPKTRVKGGGSDDQSHKRLGWDDKTERRKKIERWIRKYQRGGPYSDAIDSFALFTLSPGWDLTCEKGAEELMQKVQEFFDLPQVDMDSIMKEGITSAILAGDGYQEIIFDKATPPAVWGIVTRDPSTFKKTYDEFGRVTGYTQVLEREMGKPDEIPIEDPTIIINLMINKVPGDVYGISLWERAEDDIERDCDIIESVTKAIHRHGTPKHHWALGSENNRASEDDLDAWTSELEEMHAKTDYVTAHDVVSKILDTTGVSNVDVYSNVSLQRVACALGVPEEMMGLGRGSTEATATVRMKSYLDKISSIQEIVSRTYTTALIDRITGAPGMVWIKFNDVSPEDEAKIADWISKLRSGLDPDAVIPADWARERLGIPPDTDNKPLPGPPTTPGEQGEEVSGASEGQVPAA